MDACSEPIGLITHTSPSMSSTRSSSARMPAVTMRAYSATVKRRRCTVTGGATARAIALSSSRRTTDSAHPVYLLDYYHITERQEGVSMLAHGRRRVLETRYWIGSG